MDMRINDNDDLVKQTKSNISLLSYKDKVTIYNDFFDLGGITSMSLNNRMALVSLICLVTFKMRQKNTSETCHSVLKKIIKSEDMLRNTQFGNFIEGLSIVCENFMYSCTKFDTFGLKSSEEIVNKIKELLDEWLPF